MGLTLTIPINVFTADLIIAHQKTRQNDDGIFSEFFDFDRKPKDVTK